MNTSAIQAAVLLLGLVTIVTPSWGQSTAPLAALAVGQAEQPDARRQAEELLRRARTAMKGGNLELADRFVTDAEKLNVKYDGILARIVDTPVKARRDLDKLRKSGGKSNESKLANLFGKKSDPLRQEPPEVDGPAESGQPQRLPADVQRNANALPAGQSTNSVDNDYPYTGKVNPLAGATAAGPLGATQQALQLTAQAKAALDRGDLTLAEKLGREADRLRVPEKAFQGGDTPWELLMKVDKQRRLQGVGPASGASAESQSDVATALYDPDNDASYVRTASAEQPIPGAGLLAQQSGGTSLPGPPGGDGFLGGDARFDAGDGAGFVGGGDPNQLIQAGEEALRRRSLDEARDLFRQAWAFEAQLDPANRQRLQEHLQYLQVSEAPAAAAEATPDQQEELRIRRFIAEVSRDQAAIARELRVSPKDAWNNMKQLRARVANEDLPEAARRSVVGRLDRAVDEIGKFIDQNRAQIELDERNREVLDQIDRERRLKAETSQKLARMVDEFNELMDQQRYQEAFILAKQARELAPEELVVENMIWKSRFAERMFVELSLRDRKQIGFERALESVEESGIGFDDRNPIQFPRTWDALSKSRQRLLSDNRSRFTEVEQEIQRALRKKVQVQFDGQPLADVISTLGRMVGINTHIDTQGLAMEGASSDTPVTINLTQEVSLMSALNLILEPLRLGYVIQDEVLRVTSEVARQGDVYQEVYYVGDLVIPIPNFMPGYQNGMAGALAQAHAALGYGPGASGGQSPLVLADSGGAQQLGDQASVLAQMNASSLLTSDSGGQAPRGFGGGASGGGGTQADFDTLMELISSTVAPDSWDDVGGPGSMAPFEGNLSLVISNTQEVHEQVVDLLEQLRRLQDLQVTIEVRFITLQDNFFERIGVDFDFEIRDGTGLTQQDIADAINDGTDENLDITIGLDPQGNPSMNLNLPFNQNTLGGAIPQFGGFDPGAASTFGFAILSDIEAFFLVEALQGDTRTNVMQAPKITMFNGQFGSINDTSQRPFVTSVIPVVGDFAAAQQPVILVLAEGTQLNVQAVVSNDRRFVRLTLLPMFSQIGDVDTFTFEGRRSSATGSSTEVGPDDDRQLVQQSDEDFTEGTTVQLPTFASTSVSTTVSVPDGGTVLLGGIKRLAEGRNERAIPILGKLPYISRLFKNVGIGRETQTLMMMVTPRIIIQEEEEERILGTP